MSNVGEGYCHIGVYAWGKTNWASNYPALAPYFSALCEGPQYLTPTMYAAAIRALGLVETGAR